MLLVLEMGKKKIFLMSLLLKMLLFSIQSLSLSNCIVYSQHAKILYFEEEQMNILKQREKIAYKRAGTGNSLPSLKP